MGYIIECFDERGRRVGYAGRGRLKVNPQYYYHPSAARLGAESLMRNRPDLHTFINRFAEARNRQTRK